MPAGARFQNRRLSTFPNRQCEAADAAVVKTSAACTHQAVGHANRAIDDLGSEADQDEQEEVGAHLSADT